MTEAVVGYRVELVCKKCDQGFIAEWDFGDNVTCSNCGTVWETDYDTDYYDNISGPWITTEAGAGR